jgi:hypothetical protein
MAAVSSCWYHLALSVAHRTLLDDATACGSSGRFPPAMSFSLKSTKEMAFFGQKAIFTWGKAAVSLVGPLWSFRRSARHAKPEDQSAAHLNHP